MGLVHPDVLITRATVESAVERLALAAAHGTRQMDTIREWIERGSLTIVSEPIPGKYGPQGGAVYAEYKGSHRLTGRSWANLVKRLKASGFRAQRDLTTNTYQLYWRNY